MTLPNYPCSQQALYAVAKILLLNLQADVNDFSAFKTKYDLAFVANRKQELINAISIISEQARNEAYQKARNLLLDKSSLFFKSLQKLKRYIEDMYIFDTDNFQNALDAAGWKSYSKAQNNDWVSLLGFANAAKLYVNNNLVELQNSGFMPPAFATDFMLLLDDLDTAHTDYIAKQYQANQGQQSKVEANNIIYKEITMICKDGQQIYEDNEAQANKYTFSQLLTLVDGIGTTGIKGTISDINGNPVVNATVTIVETGATTATDKQGKYVFKAIKADEYTLTVASQGYTDNQISVALTPGVTSSHNVTMQ